MELDIVLAANIQNYKMKCICIDPQVKVFLKIQQRIHLFYFVLFFCTELSEGRQPGSLKSL